MSIIKILSIDQPWSGGCLIPAEEMAKLQQADDIIQTARDRAAVYLRSARKRRREKRAHFLKRLAQLERARRRRYEERFRQAKEEGVEAALGWVVDQQLWEQKVYKRLLRQVCEQLSDRLRTISSTFPWEQLLAEQLAPLCQEFRSSAPLTLKVASTMFNVLPEEVLVMPVNVERDETLAYGHALLETPLVRIELRLPAQIDQLCEALSRLQQEALNEPD